MLIFIPIIFISIFTVFTFTKSFQINKKPQRGLKNENVMNNQYIHCKSQNTTSQHISSTNKYASTNTHVPPTNITLASGIPILAVIQWASVFPKSHRAMSAAAFETSV